MIHTRHLFSSVCKSVVRLRTAVELLCEVLQVAGQRDLWKSDITAEAEALLLITSINQSEAFSLFASADVLKSVFGLCHTVLV